MSKAQKVAQDVEGSSKEDDPSPAGADAGIWSLLTNQVRFTQQRYGNGDAQQALLACAPEQATEETTLAPFDWSWLDDDPPQTCDLDSVSDARLTGSVGRGGVNAAGDVTLVQTRLAVRGLDPGPADGVMGQRTLAAIEAFQRSFLPAPDGLVEPGKNTERRLFDESGPVSNPGGTKGNRSKGVGGGTESGAAPTAAWAQVSQNFDATIPGSSYFTWHEALWLKSWGRYVQPSDITNTDIDTVLSNIQRQAAALDGVRAHFGKAIVVHCWLRPPAYNKAIGGATNSAHLRGTATDFHVEGMDAEDVRRELKANPEIYPGKGENKVRWVHLDLEHTAWFNP